MASPDSSGDGKTSPFGDGKGDAGSRSSGKPVDKVVQPMGGGGKGVTGDFDEGQTREYPQKEVTEHYDHSKVDMVETDGGGTEGRLPFADVDPTVKDPKGAGSIGESYKPFKNLR